MSGLMLFNEECKTVFGLNGYGEDSATYALGWTLHQSPMLLELFVESVLGNKFFELDKVTINLQKSANDRGFTDIEIKQQSIFHIIIEAKKGWELPGYAQLEKYCSRFEEDDGEYPDNARIIVSMSAVLEEHAASYVEETVGGYLLVHRSWSAVIDLIKKSVNTTTSRTEKLWLGECQKHLEGYAGMTSPTSNLAYCVVLSKDTIGESDYTWVDVVEKDQRYFHPVGVNGWPVIPPNYLAFRKDGALLSVHRVNACKVVRDLKKENKDWPETQMDHFVYDLGSPMKPTQRLKNGKLYATGRVWCALDTLLSGDYSTIAEARDETKRRMD